MPTRNQLVRNIRKRRVRRPRLLALAGAPQRRGVIYKLAIMTPRKPNSAKRKIAKVRLLFNNKKVFANIPGIGHNLHEYSVVIVRGGSAKDLPGVNYTLVRGLLDFSFREHFERVKSRSKYGIKKKDLRS
jgi:small subunit ribosomal protein S12